MIIIAAAFLILFVVWLVRRTLRRIRRAAAARAQARGAVVKAQEAPTAGPRTPDVRIAPAQPEETEPQGPRMWGDLPGDERRAAGGGGRP